MNRLLGSAILIGFSALSVLGFLAFMHDEHGHVLACMAGLDENAVCPSNVFDWLSFHIGFLKSFSVAIIAVAAFGMLAIFASSVSRSPGLLSGQSFSPARQTVILPISRFKTWQWLSLHIASPSF